MKTNNPLISVITSSYNNINTIKESVNSVLTQTYKNIEVLVLDDGSTDNTYLELKKIENNKLKIYKNKENIGLTKSLNILINKANGQYIARHDADDISFPDRLSYQMNLMELKNFQVSTTRAMSLNNNSKIPGKSFYLPNKLVMKFKNPFIHGTLLIKKNTLENIGGYDEKFYYAQDYKLFSDLLKNKVKILNINKIKYLLNMEDNISTNYKAEQQYFAECVKKDKSP